jgi:hypothetical protein
MISSDRRGHEGWPALARGGHGQRLLHPLDQHTLDLPSLERLLALEGLELSGAREAAPFVERGDLRAGAT